MQLLELEHYSAVAGGQTIQQIIAREIAKILVERGVALVESAMNQLVDYFKNKPLDQLNDVTLFNAMDNFGITPYPTQGDDADGL